MSKHTATPWEQNGIEIVAGSGEWICLMGEPAKFAGDRPRMAPNHAANAAHIVRCVNSHDALVEALKLVAFKSGNPEIVGIANRALAAAKGNA